MAINNGASTLASGTTYQITMRLGIYADFDPDKMVPGELAVVTSGDPSTEDGKCMYVCFQAGNVKRLATYEDMLEYIQNATDDIQNAFTADLQQAIKNAQSATSAANTATNKANTAAKSANNAATAANNALESIEEAVQGTIINDNSPSANTTYSGNKIDNMAKVNLFDWNGANPTNCTLTVNGNVATLKSTQVGAPQFVNKSLYLTPNKWYTIVWKSTRNGKHGGGVLVESRSTSGEKTSIFNQSEVLNSYASFLCPEDSDHIAFFAYSGKSTSHIGDTATFEVMLIEGTEYIPAMYNSRDIARFISTVSNKTNINLFDYSGILYSHCTGSVSGNTITAKISDLNAISDVKKVYSNLKKNTNYTVSFKSTRTGVNGGGIIIAGDISGNIINVGNNINAITTFNTGENNQITLRFILGYSTGGSEVGDSATFTDIMLVEGEFAPGEYVPYIGADTFSDAIAGIKTTNTEMATNILQNATDISGLQQKISDYKILWQGNYWPDDTQTCTLSEKVSEQKNGIILWFSAYNEGETSNNTGWFPYYVHKSIFEVKQNLGVSDDAGFCVPVVATGSFGTIATKYIYVYDTYVTGSASNKGKGTGKVEYNNRYWTLKAIIGW